MKYGANAYFNQSSVFQPYTPGDVMTLSTMVVLPEAETPVDAAEQVFALMTAGGRPNSNERRLSVGDVVKIIEADGTTHWFAVEPVGFRAIEPL